MVATDTVSFQVVSLLDDNRSNVWRTRSRSGNTPKNKLTNDDLGPVAQRLEQGTHNPLVGGSNPSGPTLAFGCIGSHVVAQVRKR